MSLGLCDKGSMKYIGRWNDLLTSFASVPSRGTASEARTVLSSTTQSNISRSFSESIVDSYIH